MFELCALLAPKKTAKVRKPSKPAIRIGGQAELTNNGWIVTVVRKDTKYKNAYYIAHNGKELPHSVSRDMLLVK